MTSLSTSFLSSLFNSSNSLSSSCFSRSLLLITCISPSSSSSSSSSLAIISCVTKSTHFPKYSLACDGRQVIPNSVCISSRRFVCRAAEYKFPDPIPEFADSETEKFRTHLMKRLTKKDLYGDSIEEVVGICTEIFSTFLHEEYGGPGTLLVIPFIDMADTLEERGLPGAPQAARAAVKWAQDHVDKDWKEWTGSD